MTVGWDKANSTDIYKKIILFQDGNSYKIKSADLDGGNENTFTISELSGTDFVTFSLDGSADSQIYPNDDSWDLLFSQYITQFDEETPYLVTGVLVNPLICEVSVDSTSSFNDIDLSAATSMTFSSDADGIGYDWKEYFLDEGYYLIHSDRNYVIKRQEEYYKLRFLDFYNNVGETGSMKFEIQKL